MFDLMKNTSITSRRIKGSIIRELLKLTNKPDIISLAGGLPSPDSFPSQDIQEIACKVLKERPEVALQYGSTEGFPELKREIIKLMEEDGFHGVTEDHVLITSSSQQGLDLVGRLFIDPTDPVMVELPTYVGALQAFSAYGAHFIGVKSDNDGIIDPINLFWTSEEMDDLVQYIERHAHNFLSDPASEIKNDYNRISAAEAVQRIFHSNSMEFFRKYFHSSNSNGIV